METTICSSMHCYKSAANTNDLSKPPFCDDCKKKKEKEASKAVS